MFVNYFINVNIFQKQHWLHFQWLITGFI